MNITFSIIGGDLRIINLAKMLVADENEIYTYGLEKSEELKKQKNIIVCETLQETINKSKYIISSIPFSSDGKIINAPFSNKKIFVNEFMNLLNNKILICGNVSEEIISYTKNNNVKIIDVMKIEELAILNTIATAEGTIKIIISNTDTIIHGKNILILGFGRVAKTLAKKLDSISAKVSCAARKNEDLAWIRTLGYNAVNINNIGNNLNKYDIIINTVPQMILSEEKMKYIKQDCLLIDLASKPGGIDQEVAKNKKINSIWALALPGKIAPVSTAKYIKDIIYNELKK